MSTRASVTDIDRFQVELSGVWTMVGTVIVLAVLGLVTNSYFIVFETVKSFVLLDATNLPYQGDMDVKAFGVLAAMTTITLLFGVASGLLVHKLCGPFTPNPNNFRFEGKLPYFALLMLLLIGEELFARALFLGLFGQWFDGTIPTYALFLIGNALWALVHLYNYKNPADRNVLRVLPQFVVGIFLTVIFLTYGFLAALLVHVAYDMLIFSMKKRQRLSKADILIFFYNVLLLAVGLFFIHENLSGIAEWTDFDNVFVVEGWSFGDYFWMLIVIGAGFSIVAQLLLFDRRVPTEHHGVIASAMGAVIDIGLLMGIYWAVGLFVDDVGSRLLIAALVTVFFATSRGGSELARMFWIGIPSAILVFCAVLALGFWISILMLILLALVAMPERFIDRRHLRVE